MQSEVAAVEPRLAGSAVRRCADHGERRVAEEDQLARTALENIVSELRNNVEQLRDGRAENRDLLRELQMTFEQVAGGEDPTIRSVEYEFVLLGSDAWETAQVTRAVHFMDFERVTRISQAYGIMELFSDRQDQVVDAVAGVMNGGDLLESLRPLRSALNIALDIECSVVASLDQVILELETDEVPDEDEPETECDFDGP